MVVFKQSHEHCLGRLGLVEEGLGTHLQPPHLGGVDLVIP
jgi:hypothetical protein